jgi:acetyltransferase-like isoleucine patch superfamily enzyme/glycosyltransferase involved in cell wall biosynthesis
MTQIKPSTDAPHRVGAPNPPVSVLILTLNEQVNIADCLASCAWCDDVHVLDSGSQDHTREIAESMGAAVHVNAFESFGKQRNWAIDHIPMKHSWVFHLDADERFTPELVRAIRDLLAENPTEAGFHTPQKFIFMGRWLKRSAAYPTYQMRLFHKQRMRFRDYGHGQRESTDGAVGVLDVPYMHYPFSKGIYDWLDKHNRYSSLEALQVLEGSTEALNFFDLFRGDRVRRRRAWKEFSYRLPMRPTIRLITTLFVLGGILEGRPGWTYARLISMYERMITLKLRLLRERASLVHAEFERDTHPTVRTEVFDAKDQIVEPGLEPIRPRTQAPPRVEPAETARINGELAARSDEAPHQMQPEASPWSFKEKVGRAVWMLVGRPLFRASFHNWHPYRAAILRLFGAKIGKGVSLRPTVNIEVPWMLHLDDDCTVGDYAILYSLGMIYIGKRSIISQYAHLCAGTHDYADHTFKLLRTPIHVGDDVWIGADAFIGPGVNVGDLSVVGARSSTYKHVDKRTVYVGNPARPLKERALR